MKLPIAFAALLTLAACAQPIPELPPGPVETFTYTHEMLKRGSTGGHVERPSLMTFTFETACLSTGTPARARFAQASALMAANLDKVTISGVGQSVRRSHEWSAANRLIVERTGCRVTTASFTEDYQPPQELLMWAMRNGVLAEAMGRRN